jgi:hypothetical protein
MAEENKAEEATQAPKETPSVRSEKEPTKEKPRAFPICGDPRWPSKREQNGWK